MPLKKRLFAFAVSILFLLIDTSVIPFTGLNTAYVPRLSLLSVITIALLAGRTQGILYGAITGILTDITLTIPTGLVSALYTIAGFLAGWIGRKMRVRILSSIVAPIVSMLVYELTMLVYYFMQAQTVAASQALAMLARVGIGTVLIQPLYLLYNLVLKSKRSRYAR